jgi:hypothetical protein
MKTRKNYIARSTATLTQSGLLAALLQHQRRKVIELSQRHAQREKARGLLRNTLTWLLASSHGITMASPSDLRTGNPSPAREFSEVIAMAHKVRTLAELLQQIRNDLRIQHPEWIQPTGETPMCDSYEARLMELLVGSIGSGPSETTAVSDSAFEYGRTRI